MSAMTSGLPAVFGAAFATLYDDGTLHEVTLTDDGAGGFAAGTVDSPIKVLVDTLSETDRAAGGLPRSAVTLTVLCAGLASGIDIDDSITVGGVTYRVIEVGTDPAASAFTLIGVPA